MYTSEFFSSGNKFMVSAWYRFKTVNLGLWKLMQINEGRLPYVGPHVKNHFDIISAKSSSDIEEAIEPVRQRISIDVASADFFDSLFDSF